MTVEVWDGFWRPHPSLSFEFPRTFSRFGISLAFAVYSWEKQGKENQMKKKNICVFQVFSVNQVSPLLLRTWHILIVHFYYIFLLPVIPPSSVLPLSLLLPTAITTLLTVSMSSFSILHGLSSPPKLHPTTSCQIIFEMGDKKIQNL